MPCLNEEATVSTCVRKAISWLEARAICGEVIVADNGSMDSSIKSSRQAGARVVRISNKGYGNALMGGIESARSKYLIIGDADGSYDFSRLDGFIEGLREGYDLVQGCRLPTVGGQVMPGAMPFLHRWLGNPLFSFLARWWVGSPIHDVYCGLRGFGRSFYQQLNLQCTGMEFAVEMIIKASLMKARIEEVPITLYPDGRLGRKSHLRTFRDGWRTFRCFLRCLGLPSWSSLFASRVSQFRASEIFCTCWANSLRRHTPDSRQPGFRVFFLGMLDLEDLFVNTWAEFDTVAKNYGETLSKGLSLTGEGPAFYAEKRVFVTSLLIKPKCVSTEKILDFGCGVGTSIPFLAKAFSPKEIIGVDVSEEMLAEARAGVNLAHVCVESVEKTPRNGEIDLAYCNGVFHHIKPELRAEALQRIFDSLRPAGYFALWEQSTQPRYSPRHGKVSFRQGCQADCARPS